MDPFAVILFLGGGLYCFLAFFCFGAVIAGFPRRVDDTEACYGGGSALLGAGMALCGIAGLWHLMFHA